MLIFGILNRLLIGDNVYPRYYLAWSTVVTWLIKYLEDPILELAAKANIPAGKPLSQIELEDMFDLDDLR